MTDYLENDKINIAATQKKFEEAISLLSPSDYHNYKKMVMSALENEDRKRDSAACERMVESVQQKKEE